jgi:hypothetical protein
MEPANVQLKRTLSELRQLGTTANICSGGLFLPSNYMFFWEDFQTSVKSWIEETDLSFEVSAEGSTEEQILAGNEAGIVARFNQNLGVPVTKIMQQISELQGIRFGDAQSSLSHNNRLLPDVIVLNDVNKNVRLTGEVKPFWLLNNLLLTSEGVTDSSEFFDILREPLGNAFLSFL